MQARRRFTKFLAWLVAFAMVFAIVPTAEFHAEEDEEVVHIFNFPLDQPTNQNWTEGFQHGWSEDRFISPVTGEVIADSTERREERREAGLRFIVLEFIEPPSDFRFVLQNGREDARWWVYPIYLQGGELRYIVDMEVDFPPMMLPPTADVRPDDVLSMHPGMTSEDLFRDFQIVFHTDVCATAADGSPGDGTQTWPAFLAKLDRAFLTNIHPEGMPVMDELELATWDSVTIADGAVEIQANADGYGELKLYYDYISSGISAVRMQYSIDGGATWTNLLSTVSILDLDAMPDGSRMERLPVETYYQADLRIRWIPHGLWGEADWNGGTFEITNVLLVSGMQIGERPEQISHVLGIEQIEPPEGIVARERGVVQIPTVAVRGDAPEGSGIVAWSSSDIYVARVNDGVIRGMNPGTATITAAAASDLSIFTEFTVTVTPAEPIPDIRFTITNPYAHVCWDTFGQYKTGPHTHTLNSDGDHTIAETAERFFELGFHVAAFTDHSTLGVFPDSIRTVAPGRTPETVGLMTLERVIEMEAGVGREDGRGLIFIPNSGEHDNMYIGDFGRHHVNTYWFPYGTFPNEPVLTAMDRLFEVGGLAHINHPGRYTGAEWPAPWDIAFAISTNPLMYMPYVESLRHPANIGLEIINKFDSETQAERVLWDSILSVLAPEGIFPWPFSNDDSHSNYAIGYSFNYLLMPALNLSEVRFAMEAGAILAFSRVDREYGIYPGDILDSDWDARTPARAERTAPVLDLPMPAVNRVTVDGNTITIEAENYCEIRWYADGIFLGTYNTLDLAAHQLQIFSFVRAAVVSYDYGVIYLSPFGVQIEGEERELNTVLEVNTVLEELVLPTGTTMTELGRTIPVWTRINTAEGLRNATVIWDMSNIDFDPDFIDEDQVFTVPGTVRLTQWIANPGNISLDVSIEVTVLGVPPCCDCCEDNALCHTGCGDIERYIWSINEPRDLRVSQTGTDNHVLVLDSIGIRAEDITPGLMSASIYLDIQYFPAGNNSNRRIIAWTDLSGDADEIGDITFATSAALTSGQIAWTPERIVAGEPSARIPMPQNLLFDQATGRIASTIFVILTVDNIEEAADASGNRGAAEFIRFDTIKLTLSDTYEWSADEPLRHAETGRAAYVNHVDGDGTNAQGALIQFSNIGLGDIIPTDDAVMTFTFDSPQTGNRRLNIWTDLSGADTGSVTFATMSNVHAGRIAQSAQVDGETLDVIIPAHLLYDVNTGRFAESVYLLVSLALTDTPFDDVDFREDITNIITSAELVLDGTVNVTVTAEYVFEGPDNVVDIVTASNPDNDASVVRIDLDIDSIPTHDAVLVFNFVEDPTNYAGNPVSTNRLFNVWTDLSGPADEVGLIAFGNNDNYFAGNIIRTGQLTGDRDLLTAIIPIELLYDAETGTLAAALFIFCTLASADDLFDPSSHRSDLTRVIDTLVLSVSNTNNCNCCK